MAVARRRGAAARGGGPRAALDAAFRRAPLYAIAASVIKYLAIVAITAVVWFGSYAPLGWLYARWRARMPRSTPPNGR